MIYIKKHKYTKLDFQNQHKQFFRFNESSNFIFLQNVKRMIFSSLNFVKRLILVK